MAKVKIKKYEGRKEKSKIKGRGSAMEKPSVVIPRRSDPIFLAPRP
jgi:hypothetical protein